MADSFFIFLLLLDPSPGIFRTQGASTMLAATPTTMHESLMSVKICPVCPAILFLDVRQRRFTHYPMCGMYLGVFAMALRAKSRNGAVKLGVAARYPALRSLFDELIKSAKDLGYAHSNSALANHAGVARSAVYQWISGTQRPRPAQIDAIADYFSFGKLEERARLRARIFAAVNESSERSPAVDDPWMRAIEKSGPIRVGFVEYDALGIDRFVRDLLLAFLHFLDVEYVPVRVAISEVSGKVESGELDLCCGHWLTPERLRTLRCISLPVTIGMNGLAYSEVHQSLLKLSETEPARPVQEIVAVMHRGQGPYPVARRVLGLPQARIKESAYSAKDFLRIYNGLFEAWQGNRSAPHPIILTDEIMCREIYKEMIGNHADHGFPKLLWSGVETPIKFFHDDRFLASHPRYNMAFSVRREKDTEWYNFIDDSWRIFLIGNAEFAGELCKNLDLHFKTKNEEISSLNAESRKIWEKRSEMWLPDKADDIIDLHSADIWKMIRTKHSTL